MTKNVVVQNIDRTALDIVDGLSQLGAQPSMKPKDARAT